MLHHFHFGLRLVAASGASMQVFVDGGPSGFSRVYGADFGVIRDAMLAKALRSTLPFEWPPPQFADEATQAMIALWSRFGTELRRLTKMLQLQMSGNAHILRITVFAF